MEKSNLQMFRTEVQLPPSQLQLTLQDRVLTIGSCFAEVIGTKLTKNKVPALVNPFGTIFNPLSACLLLEAALGKEYDFEEHLVQHNGIWYAYDLHSSVSSPDKAELLRLIRDRLQLTGEQLKQARLLIFTVGTAVGYSLAETGELVANCHKLPARQFTRTLLPPEVIVTAFNNLYDRLQQFNPEIQVLLTVSPVRHIKETIEINSVSKSVLRLACHQLKEAHAGVHYFPAYEIMLDDLRDYRFYKRDMVHPTDVAEDYIWQKFLHAYYHPDFYTFTQEWEKIRRALAHKPFHPHTEAHQAFLKNTIQQVQQLEKKYQLNASAEIQQLEDQRLPF
ncbi:GSCFA domain-containing protein [Botryobacter ruber]|uniref:GSCFA domain-containing protein n=1 Tax=Botryobacter ruber TaxID=2171629 RepID=UPI001F0B82CA|nr:GSCFA domain-containing protein [Botryobacter ruber]